MTIRLNAVRAACLCGVAAIGLTGLSAPASAQSLEELRRQVEILSQRIEQLENQQRAAQAGACTRPLPPRLPPPRVWWNPAMTASG